MFQLFPFIEKLFYPKEISDGSEPRLGSARGAAFFGGLGLDILRRAQARSRLGLNYLRKAQKFG